MEHVPPLVPLSALYSDLHYELIIATRGTKMCGYAESWNDMKVDEGQSTDYCVLMGAAFLNLIEGSRRQRTLNVLKSLG